MSINRILLFKFLCGVQKCNETKVLVVNGLHWHYKLQHLFCGALYNQ